MFRKQKLCLVSPPLHPTCPSCWAVLQPIPRSTGTSANCPEVFSDQHTHAISISYTYIYRLLQVYFICESLNPQLYTWCLAQIMPSCDVPPVSVPLHTLDWTPLNKLPSVHHLHHTVFSQKFTFQVRLFGNFGTLPFGCIVFHTVVHCSLHFDQVPRKCVLDTEHTWAQCPACLQPVQVDPAKTARTGPSARAHLWTVHCNTRL